MSIVSVNGAVVDGEYRYLLWRTIPHQGQSRLLWIMLNPSTADAAQDDPTVRKVLGFSRRWGYGQVRIVNLFGLRSTSPALLKTHPDPVGKRNDDFIAEAATLAHGIVYAWGGNADPQNSLARARAVAVRGLVSMYAISNAPKWCLGFTKGNQPKHPLMLGYDTERVYL